MEQANKIKQMLEDGIVPTVDNINSTKTNIEILYSPKHDPHKINVKEFCKTNREKYSIIKNFLMNRSELKNAVSISRAPQMEGRNVTVIGMVYELKKLPTGTIRLEIEDMSGKIVAIISSKNEELIKKASFITKDEVLGFIGGCSKDAFFINDIIWPDIPQRQVPTAKDDTYIAFLSDTHIGSNVFLKEEFESFIDWINGNSDDKEQQEIAKKVKYVLISGDVIDGVGIYPQQDKELHILDIYEQYKVLAKYLDQIPKDKEIIICAGTHDGVRVEDPKPKIPKHLAPGLYDIKNINLVTNPCLLKLHNVDGYPGIKVLMYHGDSFDYYINQVEALRLSGGYDKGTEVQKFFLQRRNLSPTYGGQEVLPMKEDPLILYQIPDVIHTGHIHKSDIGKYKGVLLICSSCFQGRTSYQEKLGHHPDPGKVILLNLRNLNIKILDFNKE
jgi:DNA polymerase II small subunit